MSLEAEADGVKEGVEELGGGVVDFLVRSTLALGAYVAPVGTVGEYATGGYDGVVLEKEAFLFVTSEAQTSADFGTPEVQELP